MGSSVLTTRVDEVCLVELAVCLDQVSHLPDQRIHPEQRPQAVAIEIIRGVDALLCQRLLRPHQPVVIRGGLVPGRQAGSCLLPEVALRAYATKRLLVQLFLCLSRAFLGK